MPREQKTQLQSMSEVNSEQYKSNAWRDTGAIKSSVDQYGNMQAVQQGKSSGQQLAETFGIAAKELTGVAEAGLGALKVSNQMDEKAKQEYDLGVSKAHTRILQMREDWSGQLKANNNFLDLPADQRAERLQTLEADMHQMYLGDDIKPEYTQAVTGMYHSTLNQINSGISRMEDIKNKDDFLSNHNYIATNMIKEQIEHLSTTTDPLSKDSGALDVRQSISDYYDNNIKGSKLDPGRDAYANAIISTLGNQAGSLVSSGDFAKADDIVKTLRKADKAGVSWATAVDGNGKLKFGDTIDKIEQDIYRGKESYRKQYETKMTETRDTTYSDLTLEVYNNDTPAFQAKLNDALRNKLIKPADFKTLSELHLKFQSGNMKEDNMQDYSEWSEMAMTGHLSEKQVYQMVARDEIKNKQTVKDLLGYISGYKRDLKAGAKEGESGEKGAKTAFGELIQSFYKASPIDKADFEFNKKVGYAKMTYLQLVNTKKMSPSDAFVYARKTYGLPDDPYTVHKNDEVKRKENQKVVGRNPLTPGFKVEADDQKLILEFLKANPSLTPKQTPKK